MRPFCRLLLKGIRVASPPCARNRQQLAQSLTTHRLQANLTQEELAAKLKVSRKTLQNWERGRTVPIGKFWREIRSVLARQAA